VRGRLHQAIDPRLGGGSGGQPPQLGSVSAGKGTSTSGSLLHHLASIPRRRPQKIMKKNRRRMVFVAVAVHPDLQSRPPTVYRLGKRDSLLTGNLRCKCACFCNLMEPRIRVVFDRRRLDEGIIEGIGYRRIFNPMFGQVSSSLFGGSSDVVQ
jgi:hypothetical protein